VFGELLDALVGAKDLPAHAPRRRRGERSDHEVGHGRMLFGARGVDM
jgi:hypothetical protein